MTQQEIIEGNGFIAYFLNHQPKEYYVVPKYHKHWEHLMPVVEKIESLGFTFFIFNHYARVEKEVGEVITHSYGKSKIYAAWLTVIEFIKWHNENKVKEYA